MSRHHLVVTISMLLALLALQVNDVVAGIREVLIGVDGLTCSQCTRSVEMQLRRLRFVDKVTMDLDSTQGRITLHPGAALYPERIAKAVTDAGFTIRFLHIVLDSPGDFVVNDSSIVVAELGFRTREPLPQHRNAAWKLVFPVSQFRKKNRQAASGCGMRGYDVIVWPGEG